MLCLNQVRIKFCTSYSLKYVCMKFLECHSLNQVRIKFTEHSFLKSGKQFFGCHFPNQVRIKFFECHKVLPKIVNPRDLAGNAEEEECHSVHKVRYQFSV